MPKKSVNWSSQSGAPIGLPLWSAGYACRNAHNRYGLETENPGFGSMSRFVPLCQLAEHTKSWVSDLSDYDERGIINSDQHLVFANDADGAPWILDTESLVVAPFYWKGGDWEEPSFPSFGEFIEYVFTPEEDDEDWKETLNVVLS